MAPLLSKEEGLLDLSLSAREVHDDRVVFFATHLNRWHPDGGRTYTYSYDLRAETKGTFLALPAYAEAVYAPATHGRTAAVACMLDPVGLTGAATAAGP